MKGFPRNVFIFLLAAFWPMHGYSEQEFTLDVSYYHYEEEVNGAFFMEDESAPAFISLGVRDWEGQQGPDSEYGFLYTAEVTYGVVDYSSASTGRMEKDYYKGRLEGLFTYNLGQVKPFIGLGYRALFDDSGGKTTSTGHVGYDRLSQYVYIPIGAVFQLGSDFLFKGQFNYLSYGQQTSYLSDITPLCSDLENEQTGGFGFDATANFKITDRTSIYAFYRYWDIDDSNPNTFACGGFVGIGLEPKNVTNEAGIGVAFKF
jgi:hypothetical protein